MFSVSTSVVLLVFFVSQAAGQTSVTVTPNVTANTLSTVVASETNLITTSSTTLPTTSSTTTPTAPTTKMSDQPTTLPSKKTPGQTSSTVSPTVNLTMSPTVSLAVSLTVRPSSAVVSSSSVLGAPSSGPTTTPSEKTCAKLSVFIDKPWSDDYGNNATQKFRNLSNVFSSALEKLYNDGAKYTDAEVTEVLFEKKEGKLLAEAKLSLVFKGGNKVFIEDVFKDKVGTGELDADLPVKNDSAEFDPQGVLWKDWKAKDGECEEKCDGAAGPFVIVRECQDARCSCKGHKKTKETKECTTYCSSTVDVTVSSVILVIGIFLSSSFQ